MTHLKPMVAEYAFLFRGERVLVVWLDDRTTGLLGWHLPGDRLDEGDRSVEGLCREIDEELGFRMQPAQLHAFSTALIDPPRLKYAAFFIGEAPEGDVSIERNGEGKLKRHAWLTQDEIEQEGFAFEELGPIARDAFTVHAARSDRG